MNAIETCPECGAIWSDGRDCRAHFDQMLAWDFEQPEVFGQVHHLTVLCYHLQHPSLYSPEAVEGAKLLLEDFLKKGAAPQEIRRRDRDAVDSSKRELKVTGTRERRGSYDRPIEWTMRAPDVTEGGADSYVSNVKAWARSILDALASPHPS